MRKNVLNLLLASFVFTFAACSTPKQAISLNSTTSTATSNRITQSNVDVALRAWCDGLVSISKAHAENKDYKTIAGQVLDNLYNYADAPVSFKPTLASGERTFRTTREGAAAYFIGGNSKYPEDTGFALKGWTAARYVTSSLNTDGNMAIWQGNVYITGKDGKETMVDKTFGYKRGVDGKLRIVLHHSSLPYSPAK
ncbi:MAG: hypothetical protein JNN12_12905 [Bacteroidetes Order II. Incertae sedis bacterium]|nr:hypothetical protein [Bacteroidetes Order II. bacterium]